MGYIPPPELAQSLGSAVEDLLWGAGLPDTHCGRREHAKSTNQGAKKSTQGRFHLLLGYKSCREPPGNCLRSDIDDNDIDDSDRDVRLGLEDWWLYDICYY
jgi:hypothetical protein